MKDGKLINWSELPPELIYSILIRLSVAERLQKAQNVCKSWRRVCQDPSMWQKIDVCRLWSRYLGTVVGAMDYNLEDKLCRRAVDLSHGGLLEINIEDFGSNSLLSYIAERSSNLKHLGLVWCDQITSVGLSKAAMKLPLLEYLEVTRSYTGGLDLKAVGFYCPYLKTLKLNNMGYSYKGAECDDDALAIAETMRGLRHLQLIGNRLSNAGLNAILENCPRLERLDLRDCPYINLVPDLQKPC